MRERVAVELQKLKLNGDTPSGSTPGKLLKINKDI